MFLLAKSNKDWWNVRTAAGNDGFVPKNYVKEVEPKIVQVEVAHVDVLCPDRAYAAKIFSILWHSHGWTHPAQHY